MTPLKDKYVPINYYLTLVNCVYQNSFFTNNCLAGLKRLKFDQELKNEFRTVYVFTVRKSLFLYL